MFGAFFRADVRSYEPWLTETTYVFWLQLQLYTPRALQGHVHRLLFNAEGILECVKAAWWWWEFVISQSIFGLFLKGLEFCRFVGHTPRLRMCDHYLTDYWLCLLVQQGLAQIHTHAATLKNTHVKSQLHRDANRYAKDKKSKINLMWGQMFPIFKVRLLLRSRRCGPKW